MKNITASIVAISVAFGMAVSIYVVDVLLHIAEELFAGQELRMPEQYQINRHIVFEQKTADLLFALFQALSLSGKLSVKALQLFVPVPGRLC